MKQTIIIIILYIISTKITAQEFKGHLVDEWKKPIEFANIISRTLKDSTYITGTVSDSTGTFSLPFSKDAFLQVTCIGYQTLHIYPNNLPADTIVMHQADNTLAEVTIKANQPLVKLEGNAIMASIQGSYLEKAGTAYDLLEQIPGIAKNAGEIEVIGKGTPQIYINGKLMRNSSELDQLASSQVKTVKVIRTPGTKYDASVNAIVLIKTIKPIGEGMAIDSRTMLGVKHYLYGTEEVNLNFRRNKLDIFGMLEYNKDKEQQDINTIQNVYTREYLLSQDNKNKKT